MASLSYETIEAALLTILQGISGVFAASTDVTRGDFRVLDKSNAQYRAVLLPGPFEAKPVPGFNRRGAVYATTTTWQTDIYLFARYDDDATAYVNLETARTQVILKLHQAPYANQNAVYRYFVRSGSEVAPVLDENENGPYFVYQVLRVETEELAAN